MDSETYVFIQGLGFLVDTKIFLKRVIESSGVEFHDMRGKDVDNKIKKVEELKILTSSDLSSGEREARRQDNIIDEENKKLSKRGFIRRDFSKAPSFNQDLELENKEKNWEEFNER